MDKQGLHEGFGGCMRSYLGIFFSFGRLSVHLGILVCLH